ncbi:MAG: transcription termination factor NusA [Alphaproteobacteria bacterium]|nr:transcription termination factor NusA [Alphaproteobacteria bacterium]
MQFDLKNINLVIDKLSEEKQIPKNVLLSALESAFAAAYRKEYGKSEQIIRSRFNAHTGDINFFQVKKIVTEEDILPKDTRKKSETDLRVLFNTEKHIYLNDALLLQSNAIRGGEILFPLEKKEDFGRIAAQSAKQAIVQKFHDAERDAVILQFEGKKNTIISGTVQRLERGNVYVDLGKTIAILPYAEQIRTERFKQGDLVRALIVDIDASRKFGGFIRLSRANPQFVVKLFELEVPEISQGVVSIIDIVRDAGNRTKISVATTDTAIDPVGALVGQRGVRVLAIKNELKSEQIDIVEYSSDKTQFIEDLLSPAEVVSTVYDESKEEAKITVSESQIPVIIGKGGQNLKLAARLAKVTIRVYNPENEELVFATNDGVLQTVKEFVRKPLYMKEETLPIINKEETPEPIVSQETSMDEPMEDKPATE